MFWRFVICIDFDALDICRRFVSRARCLDHRPSFWLFPCCIIMWQTSLSAVVSLAIVLIGIAFPNLFASALVLVLVDLRVGKFSCGGVFFLSIFLAGGMCVDCVISWLTESSDDNEIDVSHSNSMCVLSLPIFCGLPFPFRLGDFRILVAVVGFFGGYCFEVINGALCMICCPSAFRFIVCRMSSSIFLGGFLLGLADIDEFSAVFRCSLGACFLTFGPVGFECWAPAAEIRGLALGKCLYATKSFSCAGLHFP